ncbi:MAG: YhcH/YjgK/YiaL family protein [Proteobacteria bacterium]|nr:YhcH/YjgK/YiaL family protein [Pseudomonadota bacterium]MBU1231690.1 YhcH/YjgK/YiaL family protein [Pseudomonadota bacterium]MBU1420545.1 YhcH/YjgK/YiaL family protein [Pseudomonadota bacterium]MBU1456108.1 YhcH/YjgK/YiaL family protein [Pseudomonadota bacterium]
MIIDTLENAFLYRSLDPGIARALDYIKTTDFAGMAIGKHTIDQDRIFAIISDYQTIPCTEVELEGHRRYIDVQYLVSGTELIGYAPLLGQVPFREYDSDEDYALYRGEATFVRLSSGMFTILYPHDLHMPCIGDPSVAVRKVVVKVII